MSELRLRQNECLDSIREHYLQTIRQQLVVQATGTGKTVIFSNLLRKMEDLLPGRMLVFAHRKELIGQAADSIREWNPGVKVGIEMADQYADLDCKVIVSCVQSIGREGATRMARFGWDTIDKIVCDEAHHAVAQTYLNVLTDSGVLLPDTKKLFVGFSATPKRKALTRNQKKQVTTLDDEDLIQLKSVFKKIVYNYPIRKAIKEGWLVPLKGFRLKTVTDLSNVTTTAGDYQQDELSDTINTEDRNKDILKFWMECAENRQTVGFCAGIKHAQDLAELFREHGIKAEAVWGVDPQRSQKLTEHQRKEITVLFNDQVLTEGYDDWRVRCILLASPTKNPSKYTQEVGRGTRLQKGAGNLLEAIAKGYALEKIDCYILDVVDNSKRNTLVTFPTLFSLNPDFDLQGDDVVTAAEKVEELQEKYPTIDMSNLLDLNKVKAYIESVDLFSEPYTEEVKEFSKLTWMSTGGAYILAIPEEKGVRKEYWNYKHEKLRIETNELGQWELSHHTVNGEKLLAAYDDLKQTFEVADDLIARCRGDRTHLIERDSYWHKQPATEAAKKYLRSLAKNKPMLRCICEGSNGWSICRVCNMPKITAGEASTAINVLKARR